MEVEHHRCRIEAAALACNKPGLGDQPFRDNSSHDVDERAVTAPVANHASRVGPADACFEIASARRGSRRLWLRASLAAGGVCAAPLAPGHPREVGKHWIPRT